MKKPPQELSEEKISLLLNYPIDYADLALLYLIKNDIYSDNYYEKDIYQTDNLGEYPMERALEYIKR